MVLTVSIKSHAILGGGPFSYCVYKIDITDSAGKSWYVYRRYSEFLKLYEDSHREVGHNWQNLNVPKLEYDYGSSLYGTYTETIYHRMPLLEAFTQSIVSLDPQRLLKAVAKFIDVDNKGVSAIAALCGGPHKIAMETFLRVKHHYLSVWLKHLIILTKEGMLYELSSLQDGPAQAITVIDLKIPNVTVKGRSSKMIVDVNYNIVRNGDGDIKSSKQLYILFTNNADMAKFLRDCGEFLSGVSAGLDRGFKQKKEKEVVAAPTTEIRQVGLGNTTDVLSSTYGL